jgi:hypothetical protein
LIETHPQNVVLVNAVINLTPPDGTPSYQIGTVAFAKQYISNFKT